MQREIKKAVAPPTAILKTATDTLMSNLVSPMNMPISRLLIKIKNNILIQSPPDELREKIVEDNTFRNPKYDSNEEHGYSNWDTEAYIETYQQTEDDLIVPLGYGAQLLKLCKEQELDVKLDDQRTARQISYPTSLNGITLRQYQQRVVKEALRKTQGIVVSPTGSGKSLIGIEIIRRRQQKALIILHRSDLAQQWINVIKMSLGLDAGLIGDGKWGIGKEITVAMVQTLASRQDETMTLSDEFGLILADECHHIPSETFFNVIGKFSSKYRYALSATLNRRDGLMPMIILGIGPLIASVERREVENVQATVVTTVKLIETKCSPCAAGIDAVRHVLRRCWFDQNKCADGILALESYRRQWNETQGCWSSKPQHDKFSHAADAFRMIAVGLTRVEQSGQPVNSRTLGYSDLRQQMGSQFAGAAPIQSIDIDYKNAFRGDQRKSIF